MLTKNKFVLLITILYSAFSFSSCTKTTEDTNINIALFIPGILSESPIYQMLNQGVEKAVNDYNQTQTKDKFVHLEVLEAGTNQAEWGKKLTALAAQQKYDVIISSNPSMPDFAKPILQTFPNQKFILLDAYQNKIENIATIRYNQREQGFLAGYAAGLVTTDTTHTLKFANSAKKIALIAAQEYPTMNDIILPAFKEGAHAVDPDISVEFRIVGSWSDATKGADIAKALYNSGVDVILPIAGGASQGIISAAQEYGFYISWFDDNGFSKAPGYIISSSVMGQEKMAYEQTTLFLENKTNWGTAKTVGIKEGYIQFILDDPLFLETIPKPIQKKMALIYSEIKTEKLILDPPTN